MLKLKWTPIKIMRIDPEHS